MMSFDLNIGENVLEHMNTEDAIRELISNALDEHKLKNIQENIKIFKDNNNWIIKDLGDGITGKNFICDINKEKQKRCDMIGMFGYGLKDAIAVLRNNKIDIKIITKKNVFIPSMKEKHGTDEKTLHVDVLPNYEKINENCGTEIIMLNLEDSDMNKAKNKFVQFLDIKYLYNDDIVKIFKRDDEQSVFINGVEVYNNTDYNISYDINLNEEIKKALNRDRKSVDKKIIDCIIKKILQQITLFNTDREIINYDFFDLITEILGYDTEKKLREFNSKNIIKYLISQINENGNYLFVDKSEKTNKCAKEISNCGCNIYILGDVVIKKFKVKHAKELNYINKFYGKRMKPDSKKIHTLIDHIENKEKNKEVVRNKMNNALKSLEKSIKIPDDIRKKISNVEVDESLNEDEIDVGNEISVSCKMSDNKLAGVIFEYILSNVKNKDKDIMYNKLGELLIGKKSWFGMW